MVVSSSTRISSRRELIGDVDVDEEQSAGGHHSDPIGTYQPGAAEAAAASARISEWRVAARNSGRRRAVYGMAAVGQTNRVKAPPIVRAAEEE